MRNRNYRASSYAPTSTKLRHAKVQHVEVGFLTVKEAASKLGVNSVTVTRWCESGKLPATPRAYGKRVTWQISPQAIELFVTAEATKSEPAQFAKRTSETPQRNLKAKRTHASYFDSWVTAMAGGLLTGKPFSKRTVDDYKFYVLSKLPSANTSIRLWCALVSIWCLRVRSKLSSLIA